MAQESGTVDQDQEQAQQQGQQQERDWLPRSQIQPEDDSVLAQTSALVPRHQAFQAFGGRNRLGDVVIPQSPQHPVQSLLGEGPMEPFQVPGSGEGEGEGETPEQKKPEDQKEAEKVPPTLDRWLATNPKVGDTTSTTDGTTPMPSGTGMGAPQGSPQAQGSWVTGRGTEFGEVDNPAYGGYTEPNWNKGRWGDNLAGWDTEGVALPNVPQGTMVEVRNPVTGVSTITTVKDRGPGAQTGAVIDLLGGTRAKLGLPKNWSGQISYRLLSGVQSGGDSQGTGQADFFLKRGDKPITDANDSRLTSVSVGGENWQVNKEAAPAFQGFLADLSAAGAPVSSSGGWNNRTIAGTNKLSEHAFGGAIDVNQTSRNQVTSGFRQWIANNPGKLAQLENKWHIYGGERFGDLGHFEWNGVPLDATASTQIAQQPQQTALSDFASRFGNGLGM